jgi:hypothetical protein
MCLDILWLGLSPAHTYYKLIRVNTQPAWKVLFEQNVIDSLEGKILTSKTELQNQMI